MKPPLPNNSNLPVAVLGLGRTGRAAGRLLRERGLTVEILDSGTGDALAEAAGQMAALGIGVRLGDNALHCATNYSWAVLSPGIDPATPLVRQFFELSCPVLSEIELAWRCCEGTVVGITGTNGKTTTTGLAAHLLTAAGEKSVACGNIGRTFSEAVLEDKDSSVFVVEVSSFQLEACRTFAPKVAVWTNFSANHLDRYRDVDEYFEAKARIFAWQTESDFAVHQWGTRLPPNIKARPVSFSATSPESDFTLENGWICRQGKPVLAQSSTQLPGIHNAENLMAALGVVQSLGLDEKAAVAGAATYRPPAHRCEPVCENNGVLFVNDSKSTNLDALEKAVRSQNRPLVLIAGGKDKGFDYKPVANLIKERVAQAVLIGQMRGQISRDWAETPCVLADDLEEAVREAHRLAAPGSVVLFSPGTSSFDMFRDYEERGEAFRRAALSLKTP